MPAVPKPKTFFQKLSSLDMDDVFAYHTPRTVLIRDRKVGIARMLLVLAVFIYIVIWEIFVEKGYIRKESPVGFFARLSVKLFDESVPRPELVPTLPYCCTAPGCAESRFDSNRGRLPCVIWNDADTVYPSTEEFSAFITTRVTVTKYKGIPARCLLNEQTSNRPPQCTGWEVEMQLGPTGSVDQPKVSYYVAGAEDHSLLIGHAIYGARNDQVLSSAKMPKARMTKDGRYVVNYCAPPEQRTTDMGITCESNRARQDRPGDIMTVRDLMYYAEDADTTPTLDRRSNVTGSKNDTVRYDGAVYVVVVDYAGTSAAPDAVKYKYVVKFLPTVEYKNVERRDYFYWENGVEMVRRELWNRHGIRIIVVHSGWMGKFHFIQLLKTLVAGLALLAIAKLITEYVVMKLLPNSDIYSRYKKVYSIDFSTLKPGTREVTEDLTWGGRHLTDEVFVYGELQEEEQLVSDATRLQDIEYRGGQSREPEDREKPSPAGRDTHRRRREADRSKPAQLPPRESEAAYHTTSPTASPLPPLGRGSLPPSVDHEMVAVGPSGQPQQPTGTPPPRTVR